MTDDDPTVTNAAHYRTLWENEQVRVVEYRDAPGDSTTPHHHPDSVMITLSSFRRLLQSGDRSTEVELESGAAVWLPSQNHSGTNIGDSPTHTILVELKGEAGGDGDGNGDTMALGPAIH